mgnify:CR=1 FL=1
MNRKAVRIIVVLFLMVSCAFLGYSGVRLMNLEAEKKAAEDKLSASKIREEQLEAELRELDSEDYIEQEARSELHMIKDGEIVYIVDAPNKTAEEESEGAE